MLGLVLASSAVAQTGDACPSGPGAAFGIVAYQCANCGFKREPGDRATYQFFAEPVVTETSRTSALSVGDVIEAVNGKPITTSAGAEQFAYPPAGESSITVRRGRDRQVVRVTIALSSISCGGVDLSRFKVDDIESIEVIKGPTAVAQYGAGAENGVIVVTTKRGPSVSFRIRGDTVHFRDVVGATRTIDPLFIVDGVVQGRASTYRLRPEPQTGRYGFAVSCPHTCPATTGKDGSLFYTYYTYD
ncbi:MAG: TonB-dependent receptor plug domain-containing protein, partial [bacterium]